MTNIDLERITMKAEMGYESLKDRIHDLYDELQKKEQSYNNLSNTALQLNEKIKKLQARNQNAIDYIEKNTKRTYFGSLQANYDFDFDKLLGLLRR